MFSKSSRSYSYRLEYNSKLKASLAAKLALTNPRSHKVAMVLLVLFVMVLTSGGVGAWLYYSSQSYGRNSLDLTKPANLITKTPTLQKSDPDIPYSKTVGFIGDSLTSGCCQNATPAPVKEMELLGTGYQAINRGVTGSTTQDWLDSLLDKTLAVFKDKRVDVVQIMLGTNDVGHDTPTDQVIDNLRTITDKLIKSGVKIVIINKIPYSSSRDDLMVRYLNDSMDQLANDKGVFVGDGQAYSYFRNNQAMLVDKVHLNQEGYFALANMWAKAFRRIIFQPDQIKGSLSINEYRLRSNQELTYEVAKSINWFVSSARTRAGLTVDDQTIPTNYYRVSGDKNKTSLVLEASFLDQLSVGKHRLTVRFVDGVSFSGDFKVVAASKVD